MLSADGHEVEGLDGDKASLDEIRGTRPDLLIVDVLTRGNAATGWDVLVLARADDALAVVPIVVCTADVRQSTERLEELIRSGKIYVLAKPFTPGQLGDLIEPLLDGQRT